jgi:hypothetical protein
VTAPPITYPATPFDSVDTIVLPGWVIPAASNPVPTATFLAPTSKVHGAGDFLLYVTGTGFVPTSVVRVAGADRATTYHSPTQLVAAVLAGDIAAAGPKAIAVFSPAPAGGLSNALSLAVS